MLDTRPATRTPPPRWAVGTAHVIALTPLPSSLWRVALVLGFAGGYTEQGLVELDMSTTGSIYVLFLCVLSEGAALLSFGLVRGWGEVVPDWMPYVGGRALPARLVATTAWIGTGILAVLWTPVLIWWALPHDDMTEVGADLVGLLYLPMVAWAPLLALLTVHYQRRRAAQ